MKVTVVGAGVIGLAVAHELASRNVAVRVCEARGVGQGATRASAGMLAPYIEGHSAALLDLGARSLACFDAFIAGVHEAARQPVEYQRNGTLQVARDDEGMQQLREAASRLSVPHSVLDAASSRVLEPALGLADGALLIPDHGYVVVHSLVAALTAALEARGGVIVSEQIVDVAAEAERADAVVIAAGSWSADIPAGGCRVPVRPIRGQLLHLRLARPPLSRVVWGERCYLVPWQDGSVLVGATAEDVGFDERATAAGVRGLLDAATELLPELAAASFAEVRVGLRPATVDELPVIGRSSTMPRVYYATGHYRNGVLLTPLTALAVADLVVDGHERAELAPARPDRFGL